MHTAFNENIKGLVAGGGKAINIIWTHHSGFLKMGNKNIAAQRKSPIYGTCRKGNHTGHDNVTYGL